MWEALYKAHYPELLRYCAAACHDPALAEDLTQEVFLKALQNVDTFEGLGPSQRRAWLYRTARNLFVDAMRRTAREAAALPEVFKALQLLHEGDEVTRPGTLQQVLGRFQIEADSREQLEEVIRTIDRTVRVEDAAGQTMRLVQTMHIL